MINIEKCIRIQGELRKRSILEDRLPEGIRTIGGVDQAFPEKDRVRSCIVVLSFPELNEIEKAFSEIEMDFPYIPGLLAFREGPSIIEAYKKLRKKPDILMIDGHGIAHPRRMGIATHVGILLDIPTIGVAKKKLIGDFKAPEKVGEYEPLGYQNEIIGAVLKSREGCNPIFISPGHKISLKNGIEVVKKCLKGHKLPEPTRLAHKFVNEQ
ncbi:MAG: deoxyribonuclease V [Candidatus Altiarchaeales archaeon]|nr:MAG: deoxyribonuclease V [Candidatus Altiarchaeales archaeon]